MLSDVSTYLSVVGQRVVEVGRSYQVETADRLEVRVGPPQLISLVPAAESLAERVRGRVALLLNLILFD